MRALRPRSRDSELCQVMFPSQALTAAHVYV